MFSSLSVVYQAGVSVVIRLPHTAILIVCLLVQVTVFGYAFITNDPGLKCRFGKCSLDYMLNKLIKFEFTVPFFGLRIYEVPLGMDIEAAFRNVMSTIVGPSIFSFQYGLLEISLGLLIICYLVVLSCWKFKQLDTQLIVLSVLLVTIVSTYFSVNSSGGPRYTFAPSIMIMVLIVGAINDKTVPRALSYLSSILVILSLTVSSMEYRGVMMGFAYDPSWPKWKEELSIWKADHNYPIKIWPPSYQMTLSGK